MRFAIAAGAFREPRPWSEEMIARLKLVGEVFAQALVRARTEERLRAALAEVSALKEKLEAENVYLREAARVPAGPDALPSRADAFRRAVEEAEQVAATRTTVLLLGETGTGKELMASFIHAASPRRDRPMIKLNCAALPSSLIEAELFGPEKGAYTGALTRQIGRFELADVAPPPSEISETPGLPVGSFPLYDAGLLAADGPIARNLVLRPIFNFSLGRVESDASLAGRLIGSRIGKETEFLENGRVNAYGLGAVPELRRSEAREGARSRCSRKTRWAPSALPPRRSTNVAPHPAHRARRRERFPPLAGHAVPERRRPSP